MDTRPIPFQLTSISVPCGTCTRCCHKDMIRIMPYDDKSLYKTEPHPLIKGEVMLAHKPDESCYYLGESGCTIHATRPAQCRTFDCRVMAQRFSYTKVRKAKRMNIAVWQRGKDLIKTHPIG